MRNNLLNIIINKWVFNCIFIQQNHCWHSLVIIYKQ